MGDLADSTIELAGVFESSIALPLADRAPRAASPTSSS